MTRSRSPFKPGFGSSPPILAGRSDLIEAFADGLDDGPGSAARVSFYTGPRGIGKTVLLNALEVPALERGWITIHETCTPGLTDRLTHHRLPKVHAYLTAPPPKRRATGAAVAAVGSISWEHAPETPPDLRGWIERITDILGERDSGLLITLDEIHPAHLDELVPIATVLQHAIREDRQIAFAGAALSSSRKGIQRGDSTTFLRRSDWHEIGRIPLPEAQVALRDPIIASGRRITPDAAEQAAQQTRGYSFLVQLLGDLMWKNRPDEQVITADDLDAALPQASRRMGNSVIAPEFRDLSPVDRSYLLAMTLGDLPARTGKIAERLDVTAQYGNVYRQRLIDAGVIQSVGHGLVDFVTPGMDEYVREHTVIEELHLIRDSQGT
mgnify:CR=1 FL=1